jgi:hypothetical protein
MSACKSSLEDSVGNFRTGVDTGIDPDNSPPTLTGSPEDLVFVGREFSFAPTAADPDGDPLTFTISNKPVWADFDFGTGAMSGMPMMGNQGEYPDIRITASDGDASTFLEFDLTVSVPGSDTGNSAPRISGTPATEVAVGDTFDFRPDATDDDGDVLTFTVINLPAWADFEPNFGRISGVPTMADVGNFENIQIRVNDGQASASLEFDVNVFDPNSDNSNAPPQISGTPATTVQAGQAYSFTPTASDPDGDSLSFTISNKPSWANFDNSDGRLSGIPTESDAGVYADVRIRVTDGDRGASLAFDLTVTSSQPPPPGNNAPTISGTPATSAAVNLSYSFTPTATDADNDTLTFSISNKPGWANFNTGNGRLSGTPAAGDVGNYSNVGITVSDGMDSASLAFDLAVVSAGNASITLQWTAPTENEDGSALTDLAGFEIHYGTSPGSYNKTVNVNNPSVSSVVVENLIPDTYYFAAKSFNNGGVRSEFSQELQVQAN